MKTLTEQLKEIFGIYYVAPHASPDGVHFDEPRCGDCWCIIQKVHAHGDEESYNKVLQTIKERDDYCLGEDMEFKSDDREPDIYTIKVSMGYNHRGKEIKERQEKSL